MNEFQCSLLHHSLLVALLIDLRCFLVKFTSLSRLSLVQLVLDEACLLHIFEFNLDRTLLLLLLLLSFGSALLRAAFSGRILRRLLALHHGDCLIV